MKPTIPTLLGLLPAASVAVTIQCAPYSPASNPKPDIFTYYLDNTNGIDTPVVSDSSGVYCKTVITPSAGPHTVYGRYKLIDPPLVSEVSNTLTFTVSGTNRVPVANAGIDQEIQQGHEVTLDGSKSSDADPGTTLSYLWHQVSGTSIDLSAPNVAKPHFTPTVPDTYVFGLEVSDGLSTSSTDTVSIQVDAAPPGNSAPTANAGPDQNVVLGSFVTLDGTGSSDPDSGPSPLSYSWSALSGPVSRLSGPHLPGPTFTPATIGDYIFSLVVNDGSVNSSADTVKVTVVNPDTNSVISNNFEVYPSQFGHPSNASSYGWSTGTARSGTHFLQMVSSKSGIISQWYTTFLAKDRQIVSGQQVCASSWVKLDVANQVFMHLKFTSRCKDPLLTYAGSSVAGSSDWQEISACATVPPGTYNITASTQLNGTGTVLIDDFNVTKQ